MNGLEIAKAQIADLDGMKELFTTVAYPHYAREGDEYFNQCLHGWLRNKMETLRADVDSEVPRYWIARRAEGVVGMCGYSVEKSKVHSVYVSERRSGIGTKLMDAALSSAGIVYPVEAHVVETNETALRFYAGLGFKDSGSRGFWSLKEGEEVGMAYVTMELDSPFVG